MKRFTDTDKWRDPWFRNLSGYAKLLWSYLTENCDAIGLVSVDFRLVSQDCRLAIKEQHLTELGDRVETLGSGRYFLPKFIQFQYGELSADCPPHKTILRLIDTHKLTRSGLLYHYPNASLVATVAPTYKTRQERKGSGSEGGAGGNPEPAVEVLALLNAQTGRHFRETSVNLSFIRSRLAEAGVTLDGVKTMVLRQCARWKGTDQAEYLRPETLFNKTKFDGYYSSKDLPANQTPRVTQTAPATPLLKVKRL